MVPVYCERGVAEPSSAAATVSGSRREIGLRSPRSRGADSPSTGPKRLDAATAAGRRALGRLVSVVRTFGRALAAGLDLGLSGRAGRPGPRLGWFSGVQRLLDLEEVLGRVPCRLM